MVVSEWCILCILASSVALKTHVCGEKLLLINQFQPVASL